jgi:hypothetical protein
MVESQRHHKATVLYPIVVLSDSTNKTALDDLLLNEFGEKFNHVGCVDELAILSS